jgi:hypothetical protein
MKDKDKENLELLGILLYIAFISAICVYGLIKFL